MNDIITSSLHSDTLIGGGLASDSSSIKLADEEIIDGFSFLTFEFESDLKKEYERKRHDQIKPDTCYKSSASSNGSAKSFKRSKANKPRVKETLATSSTASNSSFNQDDDQASTVPSEDARAKTPTPPRPLSHHPDEQPSKKPKLDDSKSSYDMNTLLAAAASAAATAAVVAATSSPQQQPHQPSNSQTAPGTQFDPSSNTDPALFINKIMQMCKQQIPSLNIPGILKAEPSNIPCGVKSEANISTGVKAEANISTGVKYKSNISSGVKVEPHVPSGVKVESKAALGVKASVAKAELVKTVSPSTSKQMQSQAYHNHHQSSKPVHTNFNASSYYMAAQHPAVEAASTTDFLRRDLDAKLLRSPHMMPASSSSNMYSHVTKHHGAHTPVKPALATGLVQYYPRTSGKWCAAHAKLANMIQEHKAKSKQQRVCGQPPPPPQFSSVPNQAMFDAYHSKKLHTPTFFPPVQHNLKPSQGGARAQNYLATEAAVTAAANHQLMMDKYRQDMMRLGPPLSMPSMMPPPPPPGIPMMPPPGIHMAPFVNKSNNKPMHPPPQPLPPPPQPPHMFPFNPNPLLQHSFLQQFFMDKNFDPTRFPFPTLPHHHQQHQQPPPPPGCLMPNMLKPDDKPIT